MGFSRFLNYKPNDYTGVKTFTPNFEAYQQLLNNEDAKLNAMEVLKDTIPAHMANDREGVQGRLDEYQAKYDEVIDALQNNPSKGRALQRDMLSTIRKDNSPGGYFTQATAQKDKYDAEVARIKGAKDLEEGMKEIKLKELANNFTTATKNDDGSYDYSKLNQLEGVSYVPFQDIKPAMMDIAKQTLPEEIYKDAKVIENKDGTRSIKTTEGMIITEEELVNNMKDVMFNDPKYSEFFQDRFANGIIDEKQMVDLMFGVADIFDTNKSTSSIKINGKKTAVTKTKPTAKAKQTNTTIFREKGSFVSGNIVNTGDKDKFYEFPNEQLKRDSLGNITEELEKDFSKVVQNLETDSAKLSTNMESLFKGESEVWDEHTKQLLPLFNNYLENNVLPFEEGYQGESVEDIVTYLTENNPDLLKEIEDNFLTEGGDQYESELKRNNAVISKIRDITQEFIDPYNATKGRELKIKNTLRYERDKSIEKLIGKEKYADIKDSLYNSSMLKRESLDAMKDAVTKYNEELKKNNNSPGLLKFMENLGVDFREIAGETIYNAVSKMNKKDTDKFMKETLNLGYSNSDIEYKTIPEVVKHYEVESSLLKKILNNHPLTKTLIPKEYKYTDYVAKVYEEVYPTNAIEYTEFTSLGAAMDLSGIQDNTGTTSKYTPFQQSEYSAAVDVAFKDGTPGNLNSWEVIPINNKSIKPSGFANNFEVKSLTAMTPDIKENYQGIVHNGFTMGSDENLYLTGTAYMYDKEGKAIPDSATKVLYRNDKAIARMQEAIGDMSKVEVSTLLENKLNFAESQNPGKDFVTLEEKAMFAGTGMKANITKSSKGKYSVTIKDLNNNVIKTVSNLNNMMDVTDQVQGLAKSANLSAFDNDLKWREGEFFNSNKFLTNGTIGEGIESRYLHKDMVKSMKKLDNKIYQELGKAGSYTISSLTRSLLNPNNTLDEKGNPAPSGHLVGKGIDISYGNSSEVFKNWIEKNTEGDIESGHVRIKGTDLKVWLHDAGSGKHYDIKLN